MQHQKPGDLAARQQRICGQVGIDLFDTVAHQCPHFGLLGQVGIAGIRQVALFGPIAHGFKVDIDKGADMVALVAKGHGLFDERKELQLVLNILGRKQCAVVRAAAQTADVFVAVDDFQMAGAVDKAGIAAVEPAFGSQRLGGGGRVFVVFLQQAGALDQDFAAVGQFDVDAGNRYAHGV